MKQAPSSVKTLPAAAARAPLASQPVTGSQIAARAQVSIGNQAVLRRQALLQRHDAAAEEQDAERVADAVAGRGSGSASQLVDAVALETGTPLGPVRFHDDDAGARRAAAEDALALTSANDVYFGRHQFDPGSRDGQRLIAHELAHVAQQQSGPARLRKFEAPKHQAAEQLGLTGEGQFSDEEAFDTYFGNWTRDMNQVFVPMGIEKTGGNADFLAALVSYLGAKKFGRQFHIEDFGYYIPSEHIDSPAGLVKSLDLLEKQPTVSEPALRPPGNPSPLGGLDKQEEVAPGTKIGKADIFSVDQTGMIAFLHRTLDNVESRLRLAVNAGRTSTGRMHLGASLHAVEDLFAHSNWIEIAVSKVLAEDATLLPELTGSSRKVFNFAQDVALPSAGGGAGSRPVLMTGSFTALDTKMSIASELVNILRAPYEPPANEVEARAEETMTLVGMQTFHKQVSESPELQTLLAKTLSQNSPTFRKKPLINERLALSFVKTNPTGAYRAYLVIAHVIPWETRVAIATESHKLMAPAKHQLASQMEADALQANVADTSLLVNLDEAKRLSKGEFTEAELATMKAVETGGDQFGKKTPVAQQKQKTIDEQTLRLGDLSKTPAGVLAGPSHSMIAKDHSNSPFFGLAFAVGQAAVAKIGEKVIDAWVEAHGEQARQPEKLAATKDSGKKTAGETAGKKKTAGKTTAAETAAEEKAAFAEHRRKEFMESKEFGEQVLKYGGDPKQSYDLAGKRETSAANVAKTAAVLRAVATAPGGVDAALQSLSKATGTLNPEWAQKLSNNLSSAGSAVRQKGDAAAAAADLAGLAADLDADAKLIREARSGAAREAANDKLTADRDRVFTAMVARPDLAIGTRLAILGMLDQEIRETAVAYRTRQIDALGAAAAPRVEQMPLSDLTAERTRTPALVRLFETTREVFSHPYEQTWWRPTVVAYAKQHRAILLASIEARNARYVTFPEPRKKS